MLRRRKMRIAFGIAMLVSGGVGTSLVEAFHDVTAPDRDEKIQRQ